MLSRVAVSYEAQLGKLTWFLATFSSLQDTVLKTCFFLAVDWKLPSASYLVVFFHRPYKTWQLENLEPARKIDILTI